MGSTGSGRFTDYPGSSGETSAKARSTREGSGAGHGENQDRCLASIEETALEEIERCSYFTSNEAVPPPGTDVEVLDKPVGGRLAVAIAGTPEVVGYLPTRLNYLVSCLATGYNYPGEVTSSAESPVAVVRVQLHPST
jgi:hypothetical protein